ncbi:MAG: DMT family transporter [Alphaproteobacteria bacterium]|nr:DMT family transporter [Alphaproteobacteria bacterium]
MRFLRITGHLFLGLSPMVQAAILMILGAFFVATQNAIIRIASADIHTFEIVFFRNLFGLVAMLPLLAREGRGMLQVNHRGGLFAMSVFHLASMCCYFLAIAYLPLADVIALAFSKPLFVTLGAALILAEVVRARRWSAVLAGLLGVIIVLQPGAGVISPYALVVMVGTVLGAATSLMIKRLAGRESVSSIVWYQALFATALSLPLCFLHWRMPDMVEWLLLFAIGALGTLSWLAATRALALIDASAAAPFEFLRLPFAALIAYLLFAEIPKLTTWLGGAVIFAAAIYIAHREAAATSRGVDSRSEP